MTGAAARRGSRPVRLVLVGLVLAAATGLAVAPRRPVHGAGPVIPPADRNVLLITIDTLRADALGLAGGAAETPNLDALARSGVAFDFAHAHAVVTLPSHASILTGLYPFAHGIRDNAGYRLAGGTTTLATFLKAHGYATGAFVGAFPLDARFGLGAGFDVYDDRYPARARASDLLMPERPGDQVVAAASRWISRQRGRWFAWVHLFDPHAPYRAPSPYLERYAANPYAGEVAWVDHALGPLLDLARGASRPSLVVVTADHGESLGSHGEATHGLFAYEGTLRVPLILAATDVAPASESGRSGWPARHVDLFPTVAASLGLRPPAGLPGEPLLPPPARPSGRVSSYFESLSASINRGWAPLTGVLLGRLKFIDLPVPELYDLAGIPESSATSTTGRQTGRACWPRCSRRSRGPRWRSRPARRMRRRAAASRRSATCRRRCRARDATAWRTIRSAWWRWTRPSSRGWSCTSGATRRGRRVSMPR